jgi:hypothetical protein
VQRDRDAGAGRSRYRDRRSLRGPHHGPDVVLAEDPLDRYDIWLVLSDPPRDALLQRQKAVRDVLVGGRADDVVGDRDHLPSRLALNHTEPTPGEPRIHAQNPHAHVSYPNVCSDRRLSGVTAGRWERRAVTGFVQVAE